MDWGAFVGSKWSRKACQPPTAIDTCLGAARGWRALVSPKCSGRLSLGSRHLFRPARGWEAFWALLAHECASTACSPRQLLPCLGAIWVERYSWVRSVQKGPQPRIVPGKVSRHTVTFNTNCTKSLAAGDLLSNLFYFVDFTYIYWFDAGCLYLCLYILYLPFLVNKVVCDFIVYSLFHSLAV